jgi:succinate dehydrogenase / fumarate reductase flavoprotein subunit
MGTVVGEHLAAQEPTTPNLPDGMRAYGERAMRALVKLGESEGTVRPAEPIADLRSLMDEHAGIIRDEAGLQAGLTKLQGLQERTGDLRIEGDRTSEDFELAVDLSFMLTVAEGVLRGALLREESRGAHYRTDFTETDPEWQRTILFRRGDTGMESYTRGVSEPSPEIQEALDEGYELDYHHLE